MGLYALTLQLRLLGPFLGRSKAQESKPGLFPRPRNAETADLFLHMGGCQNYGPCLGPYYNTAPIF